MRQIEVIACYILGFFTNKLNKIMKTVLQELIGKIGMDLFAPKEEIKYYLEKEKKQIIDFAIWFNNNDNSYKSY